MLKRDNVPQGRIYHSFYSCTKPEQKKKKIFIQKKTKVLEDQNLTTYSRSQLIFRPGLSLDLTEIRIVDHLVIPTKNLYEYS